MQNKRAYAARPARARHQSTPAPAFSDDPLHAVLDGVLELVQAPQPGRLQRAAGEERGHGAGQEARRSEGGVPVRGGKVEYGAGRGNDVAGDGGDPEEDAPEQG